MSSSRVRTLPNSTGASAARYAVVIGSLVAVVWVLPPAGVVVLLALALFSLKDNKAGIQAVTLTWLLTSLNPSIYTAPPVALRWMVLLMAAVGVLWRIGFRGFADLLQRYSGLLVFGGIALASAFMSPYPGLTLSKLAGFLVGIIMILGLFGAGRTLRDGWANRWFMGVFWAVVILSAPLIVTDLGYVRNASGFQGILNHPQAMGLFLAPYMAALILMVVKHGLTTSTMAASVGAAVMLYATEARTGMLAAGIGVAIAIAVGFWAKRRNIGLEGEERRRGFTLLVLAVALVGLSQLVGGGFVEDFVFKSGDTGDLLAIIEEFESSRGVLVETSLQHFTQSPVIGNGFGVTAGLDRSNVALILGGIPISAPVESGVAISGLLEQVGVLGLLSFGLLLYQILRPVLTGRSLVALALALAAVSTNLGEATVLSLGGMGLFVWLMIGWSTMESFGVQEAEPS